MWHTGKVTGYLWAITCKHLLLSLSKLDSAYVDFTNIYLNSLITLSNEICHIHTTTLFVTYLENNVF